MAVKGIPLINGVAYTHADIVLEIFGIPRIEATSIQYADPQEITPNFATGNHPTSVGFGNVTPAGSITFSLAEIQKIAQDAGGRIQDIPFFDIAVNYVPEDGVLVRHRLKRCRFKGRDTTSETNSTQTEVTVELFIADIDYNA